MAAAVRSQWSGESLGAQYNLRRLALKAKRADSRRMLVHARGWEKTFLMCVSMLRRAVRPIRSTACEVVLRCDDFLCLLQTGIEGDENHGDDMPVQSIS